MAWHSGTYSHYKCNLLLHDVNFNWIHFENVNEVYFIFGLRPSESFTGQNYLSLLFDDDDSEIRDRLVSCTKRRKRNADGSEASSIPRRLSRSFRWKHRPFRALNKRVTTGLDPRYRESTLADTQNDPRDAGL